MLCEFLESEAKELTRRHSETDEMALRGPASGLIECSR